MLARVAGRPLVVDPRLAWRAVLIEARSTPPALRAWFAVLGLVLLVGAVAAVRALIPGDKGLATTPTFEWGLLIVGYVFFAITTSGLCLASSLGTVFGIDRFRPLEKRHAVLALLCLLTAFGLIALDLHYPVRLVFGAVFDPSPSSPMWWMGVFYGTYLVFLVTEVWSIFWFHPRIHGVACTLASAMAIIAPTTLGAVFAVLAARATWAGLFTPMVMLGTGLLAGTALLGVVLYPVVRLRRLGFERAGALGIPAIRSVLAVGLAIVATLLARQLVVGSTTPDGDLAAATRALVSGPLGLQFTGIRVVGGLLLPTVMLLLPWTRSAGGVFVASLLILVGTFADRLTFVAAGQIVPTTVTSGVVSAPYAVYAPSLVEIAILAAAVAFVAFAYTLAERYLDLRESEVHVGLWIWLPQLWHGLVPQRVPVAAEPEATQPALVPTEALAVEAIVVEPEVLPLSEPEILPAPPPEPEAVEMEIAAAERVEAAPEPEVEAVERLEAAPEPEVAEPEPEEAGPGPQGAAPEPLALDAPEAPEAPEPPESGIEAPESEWPEPIEP